MNVTESKLVVHKTMSDSSLELFADDEWLTQIVATNAERESHHKKIGLVFVWSFYKTNAALWYDSYRNSSLPTSNSPEKLSWHYPDQAAAINI